MNRKSKNYKPMKYKLTLLLISVFIPILIILGVTNFQVSQNNLQKSFLLVQSQIEENISQTITIVDEAYNMLGRSFDNKMKDGFDVLIDAYHASGKNPANMNLEMLKSQLGGEMDIYIISDDGIVEYTTFEKDQGLDFKQWEGFYSFLTGLREGTEYSSDKIASSVNDSTLRKYSYMPTPDHKYLLELGLSTDQFKDNIGNMDYLSLQQNLAQDNPALKSIRLFTVITGELYGDADFKPDEELLSIIEEISQTKSTYEIKEKNTLTKYIYVDLKSPDYASDTSKIVEITYDLELIRAPLKEQLTFSIIIIIIGILIATGIILLIAGKISKPIVAAAKFAQKIAQLDITTDVPDSFLKSKNEMGLLADAFQTIINNLKDFIRQVSYTAQQVASSAEELTATSDQASVAADEIGKTIEEIVNGANEQAKNMEEAARTINELGVLIESDQQKVKQLNSSTDRVSSLKEEGIQNIQQLVEKTQISNQAAQEIHRVIANTHQSAEKISNASSMIQNIADQTNLLALNAAIEAARAGEAGRGFSVVADEIRKLAEQSDQFTKEISKVISNLKNETQSAVKTVQEMTKIVEEQTKSVEDTKNKFDGIAQAIEITKEGIDTLNESGKMMASKKDTIIHIVENLSAISQENAAGTEETGASVEEQITSMEQIASASEELANLAEEMNQSIGRFKY